MTTVPPALVVPAAAERVRERAQRRRCRRPRSGARPRPSAVAPASGQQDAHARLLPGGPLAVDEAGDADPERRSCPRVTPQTRDGDRVVGTGHDRPEPEEPDQGDRRLLGIVEVDRQQQAGRSTTTAITRNVSSDAGPRPAAGTSPARWCRSRGSPRCDGTRGTEPVPVACSAHSAASARASASAGCTSRLSTMSVTRQAGGDGERDDRDELGGVAAHDRAAEHDAGGRVGDDLHEAPRVVRR